MKKMLSFLLALILSVSVAAVAFAEEEREVGFERFAETVEVHIGMSVSPTDTSLKDGDSVDNNVYTRYLLEEYNIKVVVDWTAASGDDYNQKVSLCIAADTLPDAMVVSSRPQFVAAVESDMLYDLSEVYEKYASDQVRQIYDTAEGKAIEAVTFDGKMLALPGVNVQADGVHVMMIQQNWLDKLGLEVPTTVAEIHEVAKAFKEAKLAGDRTIPILGAQKDSRVYADFLNPGNNTAGFEPIFTAMDAYPGYFIADENGKVQYGTLSAETRAALELLAQWYAEGLIDPEFSTRDYYSDVINANECGIFFGPWWAIGYGNNDSFVNDPEVDWQAYPVFTEDGKWNSKFRNVSNTYTLVSNDVSEDVAHAVLVMHNALVRDESELVLAGEGIGWYPLRNVMAAVDESEYSYFELLKVLNGEANPEDYANEKIYKLLAKDVATVRDVVTGYDGDDFVSRSEIDMSNTGLFQRVYSLLIGTRPLATVPVDKKVYSVTYESDGVMDRYWANLEALESSMVRSIITGNSDITAFDAFCEQWMAEGGSKVLEAVQAIYDATR